jgi:hypothetical protein
LNLDKIKGTQNEFFQNNLPSNIILQSEEEDEKEDSST